MLRIEAAKVRAGARGCQAWLLARCKVAQKERATVPSKRLPGLEISDRQDQGRCRPRGDSELPSGRTAPERKLKKKPK